jgi:hypothetical protein
MKSLLIFLGVVFLIIAAMAAPIAIGIGLYDWVGNDVEFKFALWFGFKVWVGILVVGLCVGIPCFAAGQ